MDQDVVGQLEAVLLQACVGGEAGLDDALLGVDAGAGCLVVGALQADQVGGMTRPTTLKCFVQGSAPLQFAVEPSSDADRRILFCKHCSTDLQQQVSKTTGSPGMAWSC